MMIIMIIMIIFAIIICWQVMVDILTCACTHVNIVIAVVTTTTTTTTIIIIIIIIIVNTHITHIVHELGLLVPQHCPIITITNTISISISIRISELAFDLGLTLALG